MWAQSTTLRTGSFAAVAAEEDRGKAPPLTSSATSPPPPLRGSPLPAFPQCERCGPAHASATGCREPRTRQASPRGERGGDCGGRSHYGGEAQPATTTGWRQLQRQNRAPPAVCTRLLSLKQRRRASRRLCGSEACLGAQPTPNAPQRAGGPGGGISPSAERRVKRLKRQRAVRVAAAAGGAACLPSVNCAWPTCIYAALPGVLGHG